MKHETSSSTNGYVQKGSITVSACTVHRCPAYQVAFITVQALIHGDVSAVAQREVGGEKGSQTYEVEVILLGDIIQMTLQIHMKRRAVVDWAGTARPHANT